MNNYVPLHFHSYFSLLDSIAKPSKAIKKCKNNNITACACSDHGNLYAAVKFSELCHASSIKPILGVEAYISNFPATQQNEENRHLSHAVILSKNLQGWNNLIKLVSAANKPEHFYYKPRLDIDSLLSMASPNLIYIGGHLGSTISEIIFSDLNAACNAKDETDARQYLNKNCVEDVSNYLSKLKEVFGPENVFLEVQLIDSKVNPAVNLLAKGIRHIAEKTCTKCVGTPDAHYVNREDAEDQRVMLCTSLNTTFKKITPQHGLYSFFKNSNYFLPTYEEMLEFGNTEEELRNTLLVAEMCESYQITRPPILPKFKCPGDISPAEYLKGLCEEGWKKKIAGSGVNEALYRERLNFELQTLTEIGLSDYFLIVEDIARFAEQSNILMGASRGSAGGCIVLYLLNVTKIDPIKYDLMFSRFFNKGRVTQGKISLPDVDMDFESSGREKIIQYIKNKYGEDRVSHIITLGRAQGRGALKDVLRAHGVCSFDEMNRITEYIPDEAAISDELQAMKEEDKENGGDGEASIIMWALENQGEHIKQWAFLDENKKVCGPYAQYFEQAIRLEGTKKSQGKHASAVVIANQPLNEIVPMAYDTQTKSLICGMEGESVEACGGLKLDVLSVSVMDKIHKIIDLTGGKI
jgi:DNA polymerase-3 subunit alpha